MIMCNYFDYMGLYFVNGNEEPQGSVCTGIMAKHHTKV